MRKLLVVLLKIIFDVGCFLCASSLLGKGLGIGFQRGLWVGLGIYMMWASVKPWDTD